MSDGVARVCPPAVFRFRVITSVGINPQDIRSVLAENPHLLRRYGKLVDVGKVHDSRKPVWSAAAVDGVGKRILFYSVNVFDIKRFPFGIVRRVLANTRLARASVFWFD